MPRKCTICYDDEMGNAKRAILIFHTGALGDFVLTLFVAKALQRLYPHHEIIYVSHGSKGQLASRVLGTGMSDIEGARWHTLHSPVPVLYLPARELLDRAERAICFVAGAGDVFAQNLRGLSRELQVDCVTPIPPAEWDRHVTQYYMEQLAAVLPRTLLEEALDAIGEEGLRPGAGGSADGSGVILHIGAGALRKCWAMESFLSVASELLSAGHEVALMVGEAEMERLPSRVLEQIRGEFRVAAPHDYLELMEKLSNTRLLLTGDNGPGHLAGVLGLRVLSLFGPTRAEVWRPLGPRAEVLQGEDMQSLAVARVMEKIEAMLTS